MDRKLIGSLLALCLLAGFIVPLVLTQELGYWRSPRYVSHLVWDERQASPGQSAQPQPGDPRQATAQLLAGLATATAMLAAVLLVRSWGSPPRAHRPAKEPPDPPRRGAPDSRRP